MVKLIRNQLSKRDLKSPLGSIQWKFIERLYEVQQKICMSLGTKVGKFHVQFENNKMNVKLATQVLSKSTADALKLCVELSM